MRQLAVEYKVTSLTLSRVIRRLTELGFVTTVPGKGVYAASETTIETRPGDDFEWQLSLLRPHSHRPSVVSLPQQLPADTVNLASGLMSHQAIPNQSIRRSLAKFAADYIETPVSERSPLGEIPLREWCQEYLKQFGVLIDIDHVMIITSIHQGIRLLAEALVEPGDVVLVESLSVPHVIDTLEALGARCVGIPIDTHGIDVGAVDELIRRFRPKMIFCTPTGQIPTGVTMTVERRKALVDLATLHKTIVVDFDLSSEIYYETPPPRPLKNWDKSGCVVYIREFSRVSSAGYRTSCLVAEGPLFRLLAELKRRDEPFTSTIAQMAFLAYGSSKSFGSNISRARSFYALRREAALRALEKHMPQAVSWYPPQSGFHVWLFLPRGLSAKAVVHDAATRGVLVVPSEVFSIDGRRDDGIRITFGDNDPEAIELGISRLGEVIQAHSNLNTATRSRHVYEIV